MKIAYVGPLAPHPGGSATLGNTLLAGLARRGHAISAIAPITTEALGRGDPLAGAGFTVTRYLVPQFETVPYHPASDEFRSLEGRAVAAHLPPLLEAVRPDVVIAGRETFAWHVPALARRHGVPCVVLAHGGVVWGLLDGTYPRDVAQPLLERLGEADCVIAVARHLAERLRELGLERVETIPNTVDSQAFAPAARDAALMRGLGITDHHVVVAHVSNLKHIKRGLDLVGSAALALRHDPRLLYLVVGDGPSRAEMEAECARTGILDHFRFPGWVPHEEVARYLHLADIVVMPSQVEALALAYLETQACGRVLIATDIPGAREVVEDGRTGLLFAVGDIAALVQLTLRAASDSALRTAIGTQARAAAASRPLDAALAEYEAVFTAVTRH